MTDYQRLNQASGDRRPIRRFALYAIATVLSIAALVGVVQWRGADLLWPSSPAFYNSPEAAKPFPKTLDPSTFADSHVARGYEIARRIPEVLVQQPAYCPSVIRHHHSLLDCFSSDDAARCQSCIQEAYLSDELTRAGRSAEEIRKAIFSGEWRMVKLE